MALFLSSMNHDDALLYPAFNHQQQRSWTPSEVEPDVAMVPAQADGQFVFGLQQRPNARINIAATSSPLIPLAQQDSETLYQYEIAPKQDVTQYYFGLLPETTAQVDFQTMLAASAGNANVWKHAAPAADDDLYQYEIAPKQDEQQFYFGVASRSPGPFHLDTSSTNSWQSPVQEDDENLYHYEIAPKQDAQQFYFGLAAQPARFSLTPFDLTVLPRSNDLAQPVVVAPKQDDETTFHLGGEINHVSQ